MNIFTQRSYNVLLIYFESEIVYNKDERNPNSVIKRSYIYNIHIILYTGWVMGIGLSIYRFFF